MKNSDDGRFLAGRVARSVHRASYLAIPLLALTLLCSPGALAQESPSPSPSAANTELGRENLSRVAASVQELKLVLLKDSGLLFEVKRWLAIEATSNGQVVSDVDLTEDAIFDRLATDLPFRSAVTRIVQKYGHLLPKLNPDSEAAKERDLVLQERARILAQARPTDAASERQTAASGTWNTNPCEPRRSEPCGSPADAGTAPPAPPEYVSPPSTTPELPLHPGAPGRTAGRVETAQAGFPDERSDAAFSIGGPDDPAQAMVRRIASTSSSADEQGPSTAALPGATTSELTGVEFSPGNDDGLNPGRTALSIPRQNSDGNLAANRLPNPSPAASTGPSQTLRMPQAPLETAELVRASNPYREVPSLYDMYVQAVARPAVPRRFGLQIFENGTRDEHLLPMDLTVGPDYVVGPGDALSIDLWGGITQRLYRVVDHSGQISLPDVGPLLVSGKSLADVQRAVERQLNTLFRDLSADVSLARMRTIRVYEVGEVTNPGAYDVSSLSTPLNALFAAAGPSPKGSLRLVKHLRDGQVLEVVDLYDLLLNGVRPDLKRLENGDTILVPPIGPQVTVEGMIRRPAIYELSKEKNLSSVLELAGGLLPTASYRHIEVQRVVAHEKQTMLDLEIQESDNPVEVAQKLSSFAVQDGDRIRVFAIAPYNQDVIYLAGHAARPGLYSFHSGMRVTDVIASYKDLLPEPAGTYAEIIRLNAPDFHPSVESFDLAEAIADPSQAPALQALDTIRVFSRFDFEAPPTVSVWGPVRAPGTYRTTGQIRLRDAIHLAGGLLSGATASDAQVVRYLPDGRTRISSVDLTLAVAGDPKANLLLEPRDQLLIHRNPRSIERPTVYIQGEVGKPGRYPLSAEMTVADLIRISGGLKPGADSHLADLTSYQWSDRGNLEGDRQAVQISSALAGDPSSNLRLSNGNVLTIRQLPGWNDLGAAIQVKGQVNHPGAYGIRPGERLSSILERAGGFAPDAYVYGAVLERAQVRELETKQQTEMILRIKDMQTNIQMLSENTPEQKHAKEAGLQQYQSTLSELSSNMPIGRVTIHITSDVNRWKGTALDLEARAGDVLFIPKRPSFIMVSGQVFNPTAVGYRPGKSANWYLSQSGGPTVLADKKAVFVVRADGSVLGGRESAWSGSSLGEVLQPGDTIVVPEKAVGGNIQWQNVFMAAQVASAIASTAILAVRL